MPRATKQKVVDILTPGGDYDGESSLVPFIAAAEVLVNAAAAMAIRRGFTVVDDDWITIANWVAAHMYQQSDQAYQSKGTAGASASFKGQPGKRLETTNYGQTALLMDWTGCLAIINGRQVASTGWGGKLLIDQLSADERKE